MIEANNLISHFKKEFVNVVIMSNGCESMGCWRQMRLIHREVWSWTQGALITCVMWRSSL